MFIPGYMYNATIEIRYKLLDSLCWSEWWCILWSYSNTNYGPDKLEKLVFISSQIYGFLFFQKLLNVIWSYCTVVALYCKESLGCVKSCMQTLWKLPFYCKIIIKDFLSRVSSHAPKLWGAWKPREVPQLCFTQDYFYNIAMLPVPILTLPNPVLRNRSTFVHIRDMVPGCLVIEFFIQNI